MHDPLMDWNDYIVSYRKIIWGRNINGTYHALINITVAHSL